MSPAKKSTSVPKDSRVRIAKDMGVSNDAADGRTLIEKSSGHIQHLEHGSVPPRDAHRKGYGLNQEVKSLAHIYTPWANVRANGSGIVAIAAWSKRLADEGKSETKTATAKIAEFTRGLTHR